MGELAGLQQTFHARVTAGAETDPMIASGDLGIYARMYASRLHATLADDYPKLRAALGDEAFEAVIRRYLTSHPPSSYTLRDLGLALPSFLRGDSLAWAAELATLERARVEVFDAADAAPLVAATVAALGDQLPSMVLRLVPASLVVPLGWTVDTSWSQLEDEVAFAAPVAQPRTVLVWRRGVTVVHRTLEDADEAALVPQLVVGLQFAEVCAHLVPTHGDSAPNRAIELLLRWLAAEVLVARV